MTTPAIGQPISRIDGRKKVSGRATYAAEFDMPGQAHAAIVRSTIARGRIQSIDVSEAKQAPGVIAVITKGAAQRLLASYKAAAEVTSVNKVEGGTVSNVTLLYAIPADQKAKSIVYKAATPGLPLEQ